MCSMEESGITRLVRGRAVVRGGNVAGGVDGGPVQQQMEIHVE